MSRSPTAGGGLAWPCSACLLGEMVQTPTWKRIADQRQFTTAFLTGDELGTFLGETQADVTKALEEASR